MRLISVGPTPKTSSEVGSQFRTARDLYNGPRRRRRPHRFVNISDVTVVGVPRPFGSANRKGRSSKYNNDRAARQPGGEERAKVSPGRNSPPRTTSPPVPAHHLFQTRLIILYVAGPVLIVFFAARGQTSFLVRRRLRCVIVR